MNNSGQKIDTLKEYETPEGISLRLNIAGPVPRACAWCIDLLIKGGMYLPLSVLFVFKEAGAGIYLIAVFIIEWFYPVFFEVTAGATPGKKGMGLTVVHDNGTPVMVSSSLIRNLLRAADFLPLLYGFGLVSMFVSSNFKRLGDIAAGTIVVYRDRNHDSAQLPGALPKQPPSNLNSAEQRTIMDFAERSRLLSAERKIELADILSGITRKNGKDGVEELYSYANWLFRGK